MNNLLSKIKNLKNDSWALGNSVLYKLCKDHPYHKIDKEIAAKILIIGRTYAASIERRKNKGNIINDDFYLKVVIPQIKQSGIDEWIQSCKSKGTKDTYLSIHKKTTNLFQRISGSNKRSLASKYLHFHLPNMFFIYDSRSSKGISLLFKEMNIERIKREIDNNLFDKSYASFYNKCLKAQNEIRMKYNILLNCRQLDTLLINIANENLRK
jgi:serine/threonine protein kinase